MKLFLTPKELSKSWKILPFQPLTLHGIRTAEVLVQGLCRGVLVLALPFISDIGKITQHPFQLVSVVGIVRWDGVRYSTL